MAKIRDLPGDFKEVVQPDIKTTARKSTVKKKAAAKKGVKNKAA